MREYGTWADPLSVPCHVFSAVFGGRARRLASARAASLGSRFAGRESFCLLAAVAVLAPDLGLAFQARQMASRCRLASVLGRWLMPYFTLGR